MTLNPALRTLSISGYHDLATPFRQTELDLARIAEPSRLDVRAYPGGHMTYLDDGSRRRIRDDVAAWLLAPPAPASSAARGVGDVASRSDEHRRRGGAGSSIRLQRTGAGAGRERAEGDAE